MRIIFGAFGIQVLLGILLGCDTRYKPQFAAVDVTCSFSNDAEFGTWTFSSWVEDGDGSNDIANVDVLIQDFDAENVAEVAMGEVSSEYWISTRSEDDLHILCDDKSLYLFIFTAVDASGQEATATFP